MRMAAGRSAGWLGWQGGRAVGRADSGAQVRRAGSCGADSRGGAAGGGSELRPWGLLCADVPPGLEAAPGCLPTYLLVEKAGRILF